ncbi:MAG: hypothetical protein IJV95_03660 [Clostridia bacterium]|nr:hypothetical protein [Clostridia bacterium]
MEERRIEDSSGGFIREALYVLRRNLILMLVVVILVTAIGAVFAYVRKPDYTASVKISFQAEIVDKTSPSTQITYDINAMRAYIDTVVDFVDEGVVVDRANYYYTRWLDEKAEGMKLNTFLSKVDEYAPYTEYTEVDDAYYSSGRVGVSTTVTENATQFVFSVRYADKNVDVAVEKTQILAAAFSKEICSESASGNKYFSDLNISVKSLGLESVSMDISKIMIIVIAFILGVFLAIAVAYIKNLLDNTVKSKEDLERTTGVKVLSAINYQGGESHHGKR